MVLSCAVMLAFGLCRHERVYSVLLGIIIIEALPMLRADDVDVMTAREAECSVAVARKARSASVAPRATDNMTHVFFCILFAKVRKNRDYGLEIRVID